MSRPRIGRHPPPVACPVDLAGRGNERQRDHRAATRENRAIVALHAAFFAGTGIVAVLHAPAKGWIVAALVVAYNIGLPLVARAVGRHDSSPASPCTCCRPRQHWDGRPPPPTRWPARRPPSDASRRRSQYRRSTSARSCSHTFSSTSPAGRSRPSNQTGGRRRGETWAAPATQRQETTSGLREYRSSAVQPSQMPIHDRTQGSGKNSELITRSSASNKGSAHNSHKPGPYARSVASARGDERRTPRYAVRTLFVWARVVDQLGWCSCKADSGGPHQGEPGGEPSVIRSAGPWLGSLDSCPQPLPASAPSRDQNTTKGQKPHGSWPFVERARRDSNSRPSVP
jgi:hypothetical protein